MTGIIRADTASVKPHRIHIRAAQHPVGRHCRMPLDYSNVLAAAWLNAVTNGCWAEFQRNRKIILICINSIQIPGLKLNGAVFFQSNCSLSAARLKSLRGQFSEVRNVRQLNAGID